MKKKYILLVLTLALGLTTFTACGNAASSAPTESPSTEVGSSSVESSSEEEISDETSASTMTVEGAITALTEDSITIQHKDSSLTATVTADTHITYDTGLSMTFDMLEEGDTVLVKVNEKNEATTITVVTSDED